MGRTDGFSFFAESPDSMYIAGSAAEAKTVDKFEIRSPYTEGVKIYLKTAGQIIAEKEGPVLVYENPEKGVYYAEVCQIHRTLPFGTTEERTWIITNAIVLN